LSKNGRTWTSHHAHHAIPTPPAPIYTFFFTSTTHLISFRLRSIFSIELH
jgi:hypothetical protein